MSNHRRALSTLLLTVPALVLLGRPSASQEAPPEQDTPLPAEIRVSPESLTLDVGESAQLAVQVFDAAGELLDVKVLFFSRARRSVSVDQDGKVTAVKPGSFSVVMRTANRDVPRISKSVPVSIHYPPLERIEFVEAPQRVYADTTLAYPTKVIDASGAERTNVSVIMASSDTEVATVDSFGNVRTLAPGRATLTVRAEDVRAELVLEVMPNPVRSLEFAEAPLSVRTGDVVHFAVTARDGGGATVGDAPVHFSLFTEPDDDLGPAATGQIKADGRFVAPS